MIIRFINQSGIAIEQNGFTVMIDPWFIPSTINQLWIRSIAPPVRSVDFQLRPCRDALTSFAPHCILVSLFHPHHAPLVDLYALASQSPGRFILGCPPADAKTRESIESSFSDLRGKLDLRPCEIGTEFQVGPFRIVAMPHTFPETHRSWYVESDQGSILHLTDAPIHQDENSRKIDEIWTPLKNLKPSLLFIAAGGRSVLSESEGVKKIRENQIMSPTEAARLAAYVRPKIAASFGIFNHSIREHQVDYTLPYPMVDDQFEWAMSFIAPEIRTVALKPGLVFRLAEKDRVSDASRISIEL